MTTTTIENHEIIQASQIDEEARRCLREIEEVQWKLIALRNRIQANEEINTKRVNRAGELIGKTLERMTAVNSALISASLTARGSVYSELLEI